MHMAVIIDMVRLSLRQEEVRTRFQLQQAEAVTWYDNISTVDL